MNDFKAVQGILYDEAISSDISKDMMEEDEENINDELLPFTFVSVPPFPPVLEKTGKCDVHQDVMCYGSFVKDPLVESSDDCDVTKGRNVKEENLFQNGPPQVKRESNMDTHISESVPLTDKLKHSCNDSTNGEENVFVACEQKCVIETNREVTFDSTFSIHCSEGYDARKSEDVEIKLEPICQISEVDVKEEDDFDSGSGVRSSTHCSQGCAAERTEDVEIKLEPICQISEVDVKEEDDFEAGSGVRSSEDYDGELPLIKQESDYLICGARDLQKQYYPQDMSEKFEALRTNANSIPLHLQIGNESSAVAETCELAFTQSKPCGQGREMKKRTEDDGSDSSLLHTISTVNLNKYNHEYAASSVQKDPCRERLPEFCEICGKSFNTKSNLIQHKRIHTNQRQFQCEICEKFFTKRSNLIQHKRIHTNEKPFQCEICGKSFYVRSKLKEHMRTHIGTHTVEKLFKCEICETSFSKKGNLMQHKLRHTNVKTHHCEICGNSFHEKSKLKIHMRTHTGDKPFQCEICESFFSEKGSLIIHIRTHTGEKPYGCEICKSSFNQKASLTRHKRIHTGEKPFQCEICEKTFNLKSNLMQHKRIHTNETPFQCEICLKLFKKSSNLVQHKRRHTNVKTHHCEICGNSFYEKSKLQIHMRTHTGEKPYQCEICGSSFYEKGSLNVHIRTHSVQMWNL